MTLKLKRLQHAIFNFFSKGHERSINAKKNIAASFAIKSISIAISLIFVPLTINYVNPNQYGIWLTLSSIVAWFGFFDIGFGQGLRNRFSEAKATGNMENAKKYISTTYAVLILIFICFWILFFIVNYFLNWSKILNAPLEMEVELSTLSIVIVSFFCLQIILKTISTIVIADQKPALAGFFDMIGQAIAFIIIYILTLTTKGSLVYLAFVIGFAPVLVLIVSSIYLFRTKYKEFIPKYENVDFSYAKDIMNLGIKYFIINIAIIVIYQSNNLIISQIGSPKDVTVFNIAYKYLSIILMVFTIILAPIWAAFTDAFTKNDYLWMNKTVVKLRRISYLLAISIIVLVLISKYVYKFWIGDIVSIPFSVTVVIGIYITMLMFTSLNTQILNGIGKIKVQLITYVFAIFFHIPLAFFLGKMFGIVGIILSASFFYFLIAITSIKQVNLLMSGKAKGIWNQ